MGGNLQRFTQPATQMVHEIGKSDPKDCMKFLKSADKSTIKKTSMNFLSH
jgi:hypothetical protein